MSNEPSTPSSGEIDWAALRDAATDAMSHAYAPYSRFAVGAAALVTDGRVITGCNVENISYGLTLCAECALVSLLHLTGGGQLVASTCVDSSGAVIVACGRCRQLLMEHAVPGMLVETPSGIRTIDEILPDDFAPNQLASHRSET